jgi:hypothetical protein
MSKETSSIFNVNYFSLVTSLDDRKRMQKKRPRLDPKMCSKF